MAEIEQRARTPTNLDGMRRWGYVTIDGDVLPRDARGTDRAQAAFAAELEAVEARWAERFDLPRLRPRSAAAGRRAAGHAADPRLRPVLTRGRRPPSAAPTATPRRCTSSSPTPAGHRADLRAPIEGLARGRREHAAGARRARRGSARTDRRLQGGQRDGARLARAQRLARDRQGRAAARRAADAGRRRGAGRRAGTAGAHRGARSATTSCSRRSSRSRPSVPEPSGWRAGTRQPQTLPHFPTGPAPRRLSGRCLRAEYPAPPWPTTAPSRTSASGATRSCARRPGRWRPSTARSRSRSPSSRS